MIWMLSRREKLNVAKAVSGIQKMLCAVVLVRFILNFSYKASGYSTYQEVRGREA